MILRRFRDHLLNAGTMLETLRNISNHVPFIRTEDVTKLRDLGLVVILGKGRYGLTLEGKAVLKKAYQ